MTDLRSASGGHASLQHQVAQWIVRLHSTEFSTGDAATLELLLSQDAAFATEWQLQLAIWQQSSLLSEPLLQQLTPTAATQPRDAPLQRFHRRHYWLTSLGSTGLLLLLLGGWWLTVGQPPASPEPIQLTASSQYHRNDSDQPSQLTLADGSVLTLAAHSEVRQLFSASSRRIELLKGKATFAVVKASTPFVVESGAQAVTVLGTKFDVERRADDLTVSVSEGAVLVHPKTQAPVLRHQGELPAGARQLSTAVASFAGQYRLTAGAELTVREATQLIAQQSRPAHRVTNAQLTVRNQSLATVLQLLEGRGCPPVQVTSPALLHRQISGVFQTQDCAGALQLLAKLTASQLQHTDSGYRLQVQK